MRCCGEAVAWREFEAAAPEFAARARALFEAQKHLTIATLRSDGSPRISGIECVFEDGDLWFGSMEARVKAGTSGATRASRSTAARATPRGGRGTRRRAGDRS